jgi:hypothetical protein
MMLLVYTDTLHAGTSVAVPDSPDSEGAHALPGEADA